MKRSRDAIKANLVADYAKLLDKALAAAEEVTTLSEIEDLALGLRGEVGEQVTSALLDSKSGQALPDPVCEKCGQALRYKGQKTRYLQTLSGEVQLARAYYYCATCRAGLFPPR
jgi:hypothetical protein